jgi:hypothetical protein
MDTRENLENRLRADLIGPQHDREIITDRPTDRYLTGILFPIGRVPEEEDESLGVGEEDDATSATPDEGAPLSVSFRPSSMGMSFCVAGKNPTLSITIDLAVYQYRWKKDSDSEEASEDESEGLTDQEGDRKDERWCRVPKSATFTHLLNLAAPEEIDLAKHGLPDDTTLYFQTAAIDGGWGVTAVLINNSKEGTSRLTDTLKTLFQTRMRIRGLGDTRLVARPHRTGIGHADNSEDEDSGELIYRHVSEFAVGHTCAATWTATELGEASEVLTEWIPRSVVPATSADGDKVFEHLRNSTQLKPLSAKWLAEANATDLVAGLRLLTTAYMKWIDQQRSEVKNLPARFRPTGERHVKQWLIAHERMTKAIDLIGSDEPRIRRAFQLANSAMQLQRGWATGGGNLTWRPFQLGFQLLVLASLVDPSDDNHKVMDLLWFPTGGGKTEAYLGLIAFLLFARRLKPIAQGEKSCDGVAVIMRYTLRLLTTQQFERAARLILACESIRRTDETHLGATPISIGLWVGSAATSNSVKDAHNDPQKSSLQISTCPECGSKVRCPRVDGQYAIYCENVGKCSVASSNVPLPIWTVDEDIYRKLPSLLIGTIDKFAQIVRKPETGKLFGLGTTNRPPELILQDELHLITGPLGTIAGLYEAAIDELCNAAGCRPKIIGSTATIRRASDQVKALFNRSVYQYPAPGLNADNSCFAVRDDSRPGRVYLGVTSAGRSPKFALQALSASALQASNDPSIPAGHDDDYWTLLTYFNSLRELGGAHVLMLDDVPKSITEYARRRNEQPRKLGEPVELSSNLNQAEIPQVLRALGVKRNGNGAIDVALATNMVSVGMDIPRLALMVVNGQPKTIAEYIQATSRVGRDAVPGLVITSFNVNKARDRSHYETFCSWHGTLYRDVEATSVTPFAPRAQDKALHGVLVALVRHTVNGMANSPNLSAAQRKQCSAIEKVLADRAREVDGIDGLSVPRKLSSLLDHWEQRTGIARYWNDRSYNKYPTLLMSAEAYAALKAVGKERADIWPTMNSMREVEPSCNFKLVEFLKVDEADVEDAPTMDEEQQD